jgi:hypothetical protein
MVTSAYPKSVAGAHTALAMLQQAHDPVLDSVRVESPLPGGIADVVRFLLTTVPAWVQKLGVVIAFIVAVAVVWFLFKHRQAIFDWFFARSTPAMFGLAAVTLAIFTTVAWAGASVWNYTQHENDFCSGCHVMNVAYGKMAYGKSKHAKLSCHDCHQQSIYASAHQLYLWIAERPDKIEKHANVPNAVCEKCHVTQDTAGWQRIASTAGHRVHLESDSSSLKDLKCVKCHGTDLHRFEPVKQTCGQNGCHDQTKTNIQLAKMSGQTVRHCTVCHQFTAAVPALATRDSARGTLVPGSSQCLGCHQMKKVLADFDEARDPHGGKCGTCHNPHTQKTPEAAARTCESSGCHSDTRKEPFHSGAAHRRVASQCLTCHVPHSAKVDASNCAGCHESVRARGKFKPPLPFDTTAALRRSDNSSTPHRISGTFSPHPSGTTRLALASIDNSAPRTHRDALLAFAAPVPEISYLGVGPPPAPPAAPDSFPHSRHEKIACLVCHQTGSGHGILTFERPRGCAICHHQAPAQARCTRCHSDREYGTPKQLTATVTVPGHEPKPRPVEFLHTIHAKKVCVDCHSTPVTLLPPASKATCRDCHEDHHAAGRNCSSCHSITQPKAAHKNVEASHQRCDACHTATTVARLTPTRSFCSTCHTEKATSHNPQKECTVCHFLADPATYKPKLMTRALQ